MMNNDLTISELSKLLPYLDSEAKSFLHSQGVSPESYVKYAYTSVQRNIMWVSYIGTLILTLVLGYAAYSAVFEDPDPSIPLWFDIGIVVLFAGLGFLIGILSMRKLRKTSIDSDSHKDDQEVQGYILLSFSHKTSLNHLKKIKPSIWEKIRR